MLCDDIIYNPCLKFLQEVLNEALLSANVDNPEGGLDALVQAAVCGDVRMKLIDNYMYPVSSILSLIVW